MNFRQGRAVTIASLALTFGGMSATPAFSIVHDSASKVDTDTSGLAMQGYDPVAYFAEGAPHKGDSRFRVMHDGATYYFVNSDNMKRFQENPASYLPQYGGFCAMGTAMGYKFEGDPKVWHIVDKKLYLNVNPDVDRRWSENVPTNLSRADGNWPKIQAKTPDELQ